LFAAAVEHLADLGVEVQARMVARSGPVIFRCRRQARSPCRPEQEAPSALRLMTRQPEAAMLHGAWSERLRSRTHIQQDGRTTSPAPPHPPKLPGRPFTYGRPRPDAEVRGCATGALYRRGVPPSMTSTTSYRCGSMSPASRSKRSHSLRKSGDLCADWSCSRLCHWM